MPDSKLEYGLDGATPDTQPAQPERAELAGSVVPTILLPRPHPGKPGWPIPPSMRRRRAVRALKHSSLWAYRLCLYSLLAGVLLVASCVLGVRYWLLPNIDQYSPEISAAISRAAKQRIVIGTIRGDWDGLRPRLALHNVRLYDSQGEERLVLAAVDSTLSWASLLAFEPLFHSIELTGLSFEVRRDASGALQIAGIALGGGGGEDAGLADWLLRQYRVTLRDSEVTWVDETLGGTPVRLKQVQLEVQRLFRRNRFGLRAVPPLELASPIDLRGDLDGGTVRDPRQWKGQLYLRIGYADLAALRQWVPLPVQIERGAGGMDVWVDLQGGEVRAVTADVAMSGVRTRLRADLPELELERLQGRLAWQTQPGQLEFSARALSFTTPDGLALAPADVRYGRSGREGDPRTRYEVEFDALDVAAVTRVIDSIPVDETIRARLAELHPGGTVKGCRLTWRGSVKESGEYSLRGTFEHLAVRASGYVPGFAKVSGTLAADQHGGSLTLRADASTVDMPAVFVAPLPLDALNAKVTWSMPDGHPLVRVDSLSFSSAHLEGSFVGTYQAQAQGPGRVDLAGVLARVEGAQAWRYVPLVVHNDVRDWLQAAIAGGQLHDARVTLRGELQHFPFDNDASGVFEVAATMRDGTLVYAPRWPALEDISGQVLVRGHRLTVELGSARVFGASIGPATAVLPDLGSHEPVLQVRGEGEGATADFLRFLAESPIEGLLGGFSRSAQASGRGRLALSLDVPLKHSRDTQVAGRYRFGDNVLIAGAGAPRLEQLGGVLSFNRDQVNVRNGSVRVLGMPAQYTLDPQPGGGIVVRGSGRAEMADLRQELGLPWMSHLAGTTDWSATVSLSDHGYDLVVESDLRGVSSLLPPPLAKPAASALPLRLERSPRDGGRDVVAFAVGKILSGQLAYNRSDPARVAQGELRLGGEAPAPQRDGVWLSGQLDYFDWDRWHSVLGGPRSEDQGGWAGLDLRANRVVAFSRDWTNVLMDARRTDQTWQINIAGREAAGTLTWSAGGQGSLAARFSRLFIPAAGPVLQAAPDADTGRALPLLDIVADDFRMGERQFGRLVLRAVPDRAIWRIEALDLQSPEGRISMAGTWEAWTANPSTRMDVRVEVARHRRVFRQAQAARGHQGRQRQNGGPIELERPAVRIGSGHAHGQPHAGSEERTVHQDGTRDRKADRCAQPAGAPAPRNLRLPRHLQPGLHVRRHPCQRDDPARGRAHRQFPHDRYLGARGHERGPGPGPRDAGAAGEGDSFDQRKCRPGRGDRESRGGPGHTVRAESAQGSDQPDGERRLPGDWHLGRPGDRQQETRAGRRRKPGAPVRSPHKRR